MITSDGDKQQQESVVVSGCSRMVPDSYNILIQTPLSSQEELDPPPDLHAFLKHISEDDHLNGKDLAQTKKTEERDLSTDDVLKLVTVCLCNFSCRLIY